MTASVELSSFAVKIPELAVGAASIELVEKISARIFAEILAHARSSTDAKDFTENLYAVCRDTRTGCYFWSEVSRSRSFGSTIARDDDPAYQTAVLEIHTHPPGCLEFSSQDDRDESGKFRLFGILVDIHSAKPKIRLRVGVYDSFREIPIDAVVAESSLENLFDLVGQEREMIAEICRNFGDDFDNQLLAAEYRITSDAYLSENL
jgi:hypothetical protein